MSSRMRIVIGTAVLAAAGVLAKAVAGRPSTMTSQPDGPPPRTLTPAEREFEAIVYDVAAGIYGMRIISVQGFSVEAEFRSNSGRSSWPAYFWFDSETGEASGTFPHLSAGAPRRFAREVERRLRGQAASW
ncbi:hypothetical protein [Kitasatospora sp. NPDC004289]